MELKELELHNYRNYNDQKLEFSDKLNIFLGNNAQGKTNLLESIYLLAFTRSHRTYKDKELMQQGMARAKIKAVIKRKNGHLPLEIELTSKGKKTKVNHLEQAKLSNYLGKFNVVLFAPEDLELIKGTPAQRRKFIDMELGQIKPLYVHHLMKYQKFLKQRNHLLKEKKIDEIMLDVLDKELAKHGTYIMQERFKFINELEKLASKMHTQISKQKEKLTLKYSTFLAIDDNLEDNFLESLKEIRKRDIDQQITSKGPHRDDLLMFINGNDVQKYGSQGQQRLTALSLKLSEVELIKRETGEYPVLLLDDVMSELDNDRQLQLMKVIEDKVQTFITTTTLEHLRSKIDFKPRIFEIKNGQAVERDDDFGRKSTNE